MHDFSNYYCLHRLSCILKKMTLDCWKNLEKILMKWKHFVFGTKKIEKMKYILGSRIIDQMTFICQLCTLRKLTNSHPNVWIKLSLKVLNKGQGYLHSHESLTCSLFTGWESKMLAICTVTINIVKRVWNEGYLNIKDYFLSY